MFRLGSKDVYKRQEIGWENTMKKAKEAGIPIILINRTVNCADESLWTTYIVNDWYGEGEMAGKWIIENIKAGKNVDEEIKVLEVTGEYYSQYSNNYNESIKINQIKEGFRKGIEKNEKVRIVDNLIRDEDQCTWLPRRNDRSCPCIWRRLRWRPRPS